MQITNLRNRATRQARVQRQGPGYGSGVEVLGVDSSQHRREMVPNCIRNDSANLTPFRQNPYTHSLSSAV